jgi:hypothetical protein
MRSASEPIGLYGRWGTKKSNEVSVPRDDFNWVRRPRRAGHNPEGKSRNQAKPKQTTQHGTLPTNSIKARKGCFTSKHSEDRALAGTIGAVNQEVMARLDSAGQAIHQTLAGWVNNIDIFKDNGISERDQLFALGCEASGVKLVFVEHDEELLQFRHTGKVARKLHHSLVQFHQLAESQERVRHRRSNEAKVMTKLTAVVRVKILASGGHSVRVSETETPRHNVWKLLGHEVIEGSINPVGFSLEE